MKLFIAFTTILFTFHSRIHSNELPFRYHDLFLGMDLSKFYDILKLQKFVGRDNKFVIANYHDAAVMLIFDNNNKNIFINIKKDTKDPSKTLSSELTRLKSIYGDPINSNPKILYYEFMHTQSYVLLRLKKIDSGYNHFLVFSDSRENEEYRKMKTE